MDKKKILFVCIHNSARSQMAEAFLNNLGEGKFIAESAGIEPGVLNPLVVKSMSDTGIDISGNPTNDVFEFFKEGRRYDFVITVCDEASGQRCPIFPGARERINWSFEDPSSLQGTEDEKLAKIAVIRDSIKQKVEEFIKSI
ncbi:MAG: arsenate reductase ArsC [Ignavibacteria bacterium]|jgi:arsenate reductase|nr:arsenate reductase ArsC [Ignavibacteria bacterium]